MAGLGYDDIVRLVRFDQRFALTMSGALTRAEVADAHVVIRAWRHAMPNASVLDRLQDVIRAHGHPSTLVLRTTAYFCAHGIGDHLVSDLPTRSALQRVRAWFAVRRESRARRWLARR